MLLLTDLQGNKTNLVSFTDLRRKRAVNSDRSITLVVYYADVDNDAYDMVQEETQIRLDGETYIIKMVEEEGIGASKMKTVSAIHEFFCNMIDGYFYEAINGTYQLHTMCFRIFEETGYTYQVVDEFDSVRWDNFGDDNRLALFQKVLDAYGAEFELAGSLVRLKKQVGADTDFQLRFGFNTDAIEKTIDTTNLTTYVKGYGKPTSTGGYEVQGEYFSPNVPLYGIRHAKPVRDDRITSTSTLNAAMKRAVSDAPVLSFKLAYKVLIDQGYDGVPNEGDRMYLIYIPLLINAWVRVLEVEDFFDNNLDIVDMSITIANKRKNIIDSQVQFSQTSKEVSKVFTPTGAVKDDVLSTDVKAAVSAVQSAQKEVVFDNGLRLIDSEDNAKRVVFAAAGIGITNDGGVTPYRTALTGDGLNADVVIGDFPKSRITGLTTDLNALGGRLDSLELTRTNQLKSARGTTLERPVLLATDDGFTYYDRDLLKLILWNGTAWTNVDGTTL